PKDSLLLLLSALPEALPETILSRCISIPLALDGEPSSKKEQEKLVKLLQQASRQPTWSIQFAYRLAQEFQQLLRAVREEVKQETAALARRFGTAEILKRIRSLEELRDHLGRNIHESLAIEVAFLTIFTS